MNSYTVHVFTLPYTYLVEHVLIAASGISLAKKSDKILRMKISRMHGNFNSN